MGKATKKVLERKSLLTVEEAQSKTHDERLKKCRYCTNEKDSKRFYKSQDFLDTDGKLSICIDCCTYIFNHFYQLHGRIDIALYEVCKCVNIRYDSKAYSSLMKALEKNSMQNVIKEINGEYSDDDNEDQSIEQIAVNTRTSLFGKYYQILQNIYRNSEDFDLTFDVYKNDRPEGYEDKSTDKPVTEVLDELYSNKLSMLEKKWGKELDDEDYQFLESEYSSWAKTKDTDDKATDILIKEICLHQLNMKKSREDGDGIKKSDVDILTTLMDKCNVTPDRQKENSSNKSANAYGSWVKEIETLSPAEWVENKKMFKDVEGIDQYVKMTYDRAVKNYIGMQRDFRIIADQMDKEAENAEIGEIVEMVDSDSEDPEDGDTNGT